MNTIGKHSKVSSRFLIALSTILFISCESKEIKSDEAYEIAKESKVFTDDSLGADSLPVLNTKAESNIKTKLVIIDSWEKYEKEIDLEIKLNEKIISDLRLLGGSSVKTFKKISLLEKTNLDLQKRLIEYHKKCNSDLEKFKLEMAFDLNKLKDELNSISVTDKTN